MFLVILWELILKLFYWEDIGVLLVFIVLMGYIWVLGICIVFVVVISRWFRSIEEFVELCYLGKGIYFSGLEDMFVNKNLKDKIKMIKKNEFEFWIKVLILLSKEYL